MNFNMFGGMMPIMRDPNTYSEQLRCFSVAYFNRYNSDQVKKVNQSDKAVLPESMLDKLTRMNLTFPMLFRIERTNNLTGEKKHTHIGVMEFNAEEGRCYLPYWIMKQLNISEEGCMCTLTYRSMLEGTFAKFKAMTPEFHDLSDQRAVLEMKLGPFSCLTKGDIIPIEHADRTYELLVTELKPASPVRIAECNVAFDVEPAEGYQRMDESSKQKSVAPNPLAQDPHALELPPNVQEPSPEDAFVPFSGNGRRIDGKKNRTTSNRTLTTIANERAGTSSSKPSSAINGSTAGSSHTVDSKLNVDSNSGFPDFDYQPGYISFQRDYIIPERLVEMRKEKERKDALGKDGETNDSIPLVANKNKIMPFTGKGRCLR